ncbi:MAG TPA: hypothetical protein DDY20_12190 [Desulfobulbaceae bacterium]|nr:hypothetical protein [Desulfobulbaceae bacterium]
MDWAREMAQRLSAAAHGEKDGIVAEYQALTGKKPATLYRIAKKFGFDSGRKKRDDAGTLRCGLTEEQLQFMSALIQESAREVKGTILPLSEVMQMSLDQGVLQKGQISEARLQAILRDREMNSTALNALEPSIRMASLHPNHVHIFDASVCIQYYLKNGRGLALMDERDYREKKPANLAKIKQRLIRMVLADHYSHWLWVKYYAAAGENQQITFDFLTSAWRGGHHEKLPFRGVPKYLLMDAGSANIAKGILNLLERLDIEIPKNMPHNPRRQGSAEVAQNIIETHFEARLRFEPATTVEELNAWVTDWLVWWNGTRVVRRHKMTRTDCWLTIRQEMLRDLPTDELLRDLYAEPEVERTVRQDNTITFRNETYRLKHIPGIRPGKKVTVILRPYHWPQVAVHFGEVDYLVDPVGTLAGGFSADSAIIGTEFKAQPETTVQRVRKTNENLAHGEQKQKGSVPFGGTLQVFGHQADKVAAVPMPRRGTPMEAGRSIVAAQIPVAELLKRLRDAVGRVPPELNRELRAEFGETVDVKAAEAVVAAVTDGRPWQPAALQRQAL